MKNVLWCFVLVVVGLSSCEKTTTPPNIYFCTLYDYSVNGVQKTIPNKNPFSLAGMAVASTDVYTVGEEGVSKKPGYMLSVAKYWKNGIGFNLTDSTRGSWGTDIFIDGNAIYVCGTETRDTTSGVKFGETVGLQNLVAKYWKNSVATSLTDGSTDAVATRMVVNNGDIYVIGTEKDVDTKNRVVKLWKNGQPTILTDASQDATANDLVVSGDQVYVLADVFDSSLGWQTKLWKNGVPETLTSGSYTTHSHALFAFNSDIYVVGEAGTTSGWKSLYWKNGKSVDLIINKENSLALCAFVLNGQIYIGGQAYDNSGYNSYYYDGSVHLLNTNPIFSLFVRN